MSLIRILTCATSVVFLSWIGSNAVDVGKGSYVFDAYGLPYERLIYDTINGVPVSATYIGLDSSETAICLNPTNRAVIFRNHAECDSFLSENIFFHLDSNFQYRSIFGLLIDENGIVKDIRLLLKENHSVECDSIALTIASLIKPKAPATKDNKSVNSFHLFILYIGNTTKLIY